MTTSIAVSVVYVDAEQQVRLTLNVDTDTTVWQVIQQSGVLTQLGLSWPMPVGIFGQRVEQPEQHVVCAGDRVELYRPLTRDPKDVRRQRAERYPVGRRQPRRPIRT
ncbi:MAG: RnfH family protein [Pseudomonadota bacterium]|nr:RnfH family protein [Pseudomonadota bacterium]